MNPRYNRGILPVTARGFMPVAWRGLPRPRDRLRMTRLVCLGRNVVFAGSFNPPIVPLAKGDSAGLPLSKGCGVGRVIRVAWRGLPRPRDRLRTNGSPPSVGGLCDEPWSGGAGTPCSPPW